MEEGFEIKCLKCGSSDCEVKYDCYDEGDYDDIDIYIKCNNCGQNECC